jgi:hypothetical protein
MARLTSQTRRVAGVPVTVVLLRCLALASLCNWRHQAHGQQTCIADGRLTFHKQQNCDHNAANMYASLA